MPKFYSELQEASLENLSSDPSGTIAGKVWHNTTEVRVKTDDGTNKRALLRNDLKCHIGNNGTAANNIRLHRGASPVLQFVKGDDATAEGTLSTSLAQISAKMENYTDSGKPAAGNAGRIIYATDLATWLGDNGSSYTPLGGGGGGGSFQWVEDALSPVQDTENNLEVYKYGAALTQNIYTSIRVPNSYIAGRQINMRLTFYSPDSSGTVIMRTQATLIRTGTDAITSTTNQRTSTNTAVTLASANRLESAVLDLTSSTGTINSVAIAAGHLILVRLYRDTDTATSDVASLAKSVEVTFS